jgi:hypothetical protein
MKGNPAIIIFRWGLAFVFFYAAVAALRHPEAWIGFLPGFLTDIFPGRLLIAGFSIYQLILAVWLFTGKKLTWSSVLAAATLVGITATNFEIIDLTFRDVGLAMAALALFELARQKNFKEDKK